MPSKYNLPMFLEEKVGGTFSQPEVTTRKRFVLYESSGKGPYQQCRDCRAVWSDWNSKAPVKEKNEKPEKYSKRIKLFLAENPVPAVDFVIRGASRCLTHIRGFHMKRLEVGEIDKKKFDDIILDAESRDADHAKIRMNPQVDV